MKKKVIVSAVATLVAAGIYTASTLAGGESWTEKLKGLRRSVEELPWKAAEATQEGRFQQYRADSTRQEQIELARLNLAIKGLIPSAPSFIGKMEGVVDRQTRIGYALQACRDEIANFINTYESETKGCKLEGDQRGYLGLELGGQPVVTGICPTECKTKMWQVLKTIALEARESDERITKDLIAHIFAVPLTGTHQCSPLIGQQLLYRLIPMNMQYRILGHTLTPVPNFPANAICQELYKQAHDR